MAGLCAGKDCRKRCEFAKMRDALEGHCDVIELKCIGICKGPVVVAHAGTADAVVLAKVRSKKERRSVIRLIDQPARLSPQLKKLEVLAKGRKAALKQLRSAEFN